MVLVTAALAEETRVALESAGQFRKAGVAGLLEAQRDGMRFHVLRTGVGPRAAAGRFAEVLRDIRPSLVLITGYAGALKSGLELGDLVAIDRSSLLGKMSSKAPAAGDPVCQGSWNLPASRDLARVAAAAGLAIKIGEGITSYAVVGDPFHKELLHRQFGAVVVDMETAVLAREAELAGIPAACVRAVTDPADDPFLKPFSFRSRAARVRTHVNSLATGRLLHDLQEWNSRTETARTSLGRFLHVYLESLEPDSAPD